VPGILYVRPDRLLWGRLGAHLVCERYISGGTLQEKANRERYTADIARFFSRMHEVTRPWWGKPGERRTGGLYDYLEKKIKDKLRALGKRDEWFCGKRADHIVRWIAGWKAAVEQISTYSLSHCDPNPANILTADDGSIYLLDTGGIRYLPRAIDYYTLQLYLCENDESKAAAFHRAYAEAAGPGQIEALSCAQLFFKLYVIVHFMSRLTLLYRGASEEEPYRNDYRRYIAMGKQMITDIAL
jgi:Ser/Thr protein kinase RdoA (MazF antagonist)